MNSRCAWVTPLCAAIVLSFYLWPTDVAAYCHLTTIDPPRDQLCSTEGRVLAWFDRCTTVALLPRRRQSIPQSTILTTIRTSFDTWNEVQCDGESAALEATISDTPATEDTPRHGSSGGNQNVIMFVDSEATWTARGNPRTAIGLTSVFHSKKTGRILGADMEINDWNVTLGICGTRCAGGITDLENVLTHEAGHFYGLGHVDDSAATMFSQAPAGDVAKRDLQADDIAGLCDTYPPGTFYTPACTGSVYTDMYADDGCSCSALGHARDSRAWWWMFPGALYFAARMRRRQRTRAASF